MRTIYLVRHAEPDTGGKKVYLGQKDVPLTPAGEAQAVRLSGYFAGRRLDGIFCSPLRRTFATARILAETSGHTAVKIRPVPGLMEMDLGRWDGLSFDEIRAAYPAEYEARGRAIGRYVTPGGESYEQAGARFVKAFEAILAETAGDLLVVAHAGVIRAFLCMLTGTDIDGLQRFQIPYASVTVLRETCGPDAGAERFRSYVPVTIGMCPGEDGGDT